MKTTETMKLCDWTGTSRTESDILGTTRKESKWKKMIGESFQEVTSQLFKVTSENDRNSWNSNMPSNHYTRTN